jgi:phage terminase small subunit
MGKKKSEKASIRQRKYVKGVLSGKSGRQAAKDAGYSARTADRATVQIESKPAVVQAFKAVLEKAGITDELLARRLREGVDAKETKFFAHQGKVIDKRQTVHHGERRAHVELAMKIKGHLIDKHEITGQISLAEILAASFEKGKRESE